MKSFYRRMVEEKGLINKDIEIEVDGMVHYMNVEQIIELIENAPAGEQKKIKDTFSKIDFNNGSILHYIEFLAGAFVRMNY